MSAPSIREYTDDTLQLTSVSTVMAAINFPYDGLVDPEAGELLKALDSNAFAAANDGVNIIPVDLCAALKEQARGR